MLLCVITLVLATMPSADQLLTQGDWHDGVCVCVCLRACVCVTVCVQYMQCTYVCVIVL